MGDYIFRFERGDRGVAMCRDDDGMYRVVLCRTGAADDVLVGVLEERDDAAHVFICKVGRLVSEWEREDR